MSEKDKMAVKTIIGYCDSLQDHIQVLKNIWKVFYN